MLYLCVFPCKKHVKKSTQCKETHLSSILVWFQCKQTHNVVLRCSTQVCFLVLVTFFSMFPCTKMCFIDNALLRCVSLQETCQKVNLVQGNTSKQSTLVCFVVQGNTSKLVQLLCAKGVFPCASCIFQYALLKSK